MGSLKLGMGKMSKGKKPVGAEPSNPQIDQVDLTLWPNCSGRYPSVNASRASR
jgi:hypothetical protein